MTVDLRGVPTSRLLGGAGARAEQGLDTPLREYVTRRLETTGE
jgi:hypothetical protein